MADVEQSLNLLAHQLRDELRGMWRFRWKAMAVAWGVLIAGALAVATLPDTYQATSKVYVDAGSRLGKLLQGLAVETNVETQLAVVRQTLLGRPNLEKLASSPEYGSKERTPAQMDRTIESLRKKIEILPVRGAETGGAIILGVNFEDTSRNRALFVVRSLVEGFVSETQDVTRTKAEEAQSFLLTSPTNDFTLEEPDPKPSEPGPKPIPWVSRAPSTSGIMLRRAARPPSIRRPVPASMTRIHLSQGSIAAVD